MRNIVLATTFLTGFAITQAQATEACPAADAYLKDGAKVADKDLATAIDCLADKLPDDVTKSTDADAKAVEQIQKLANKIIGNGLTAEGPGVAGATTGLAAAVAVVKKPVFDDPGTQQEPAKSENTLAAEAIACEADKLMESMRPGSPPTAEPNTCSNPAGSTGEVKKYANKIIGNG